MTRIRMLWVLAGIGIAGPASAHSGAALSGGFLAGFVHPFSGPDHLLAMVAVGLWGAFLGRPLLIILPIVFPTVMALGGALGMVGAPMLPVELGIAVSVIALGASVASGWRAPVWLASAMIAVFAIFHGYAHGSELPSMADPVAFSLGFVLATGTLHVVGIAFGLLADGKRGRAVVRCGGGLIVVAGWYYLAAATRVIA